MPPPAMAFTGCLFLTNDVLDARGLKCPLPVLKMEKRLAAMAPGAMLNVWATDPMAKIDIPLHCQQQGYACSLVTNGNELHFTIIKA